MNVRYAMLAAVALLAALAFWGLDRYAVNNIDDFGYSLVSEWQPTPDGGYITRHRPVDTLADAVASQRVDYVHKNGRFIVHTLTQWFCGALPMSVFAMCNSLAFGGFVLFLCLVAIERRRLSLPRCLLTAALAWLTCRTLMMMSLGAVSAAVNYLWTAAATLAVLYAFEHLSERQISRTFLPLIALGGALAGSMQEGFSISVAVAMTLEAIINRREQTAATLTLLGGYLLGTAAVTLAPANFARTAITGLGPNAAPLVALAVEPIVVVAAVILCIAAIVNRRQTTLVLRASRVYIIAALIATAFACFGAYTGGWQLIMVHVVALVVALRLLDDVLLRRPVTAWTAALAATALIAATYLPTLNARRLLYDDQQDVYNQVRNPNFDGIVDISRATDHYRTARSHPLWFVFGENVGFNLRALVNDNQRCACPLLSAFVTRGASLEKVRAIAPDSPRKIADICRNTTIKGNAVPLATDVAVAALECHLPREKVALEVDIQKRGRTTTTTLRANQAFDFAGTTYYIFSYNDYELYVGNSRLRIEN